MFPKKIIMIATILTALAGTLSAGLLGEIGDVDRAISRTDLIIKAKVDKISDPLVKRKIKLFEKRRRYIGPRKVFSLKTLAILDNPSNVSVPARFDLHQENMVMPIYHLSQYKNTEVEKGQAYLLLYGYNRQNELDITKVLTLRGILPAHEKNLKHPADLPVSQKLHREISFFLKKTRDATKRIYLMSLLSRFESK